MLPMILMSREQAIATRAQRITELAKGSLLNYSVHAAM
jgi:hypothetical protein